MANSLHDKIILEEINLNYVSPFDVWVDNEDSGPMKLEITTANENYKDAQRFVLCILGGEQSYF